MKRSPSLLRRMPPSPRAASESRMPIFQMPVGWNWKNSMSSSGRPLRQMIPGPSPVRVWALEETLYILPKPPEQLDAKLPDITEFARTYLGIEPYDDPIPIQPTAHYAMGGIPTDLLGRVLASTDTVVPGLYAAGECACVSVHGANRLGTNSLLDINVFGKRSGIAAAEYAASAPMPELPPDPATYVENMLTRLLDNAGGESVAAIRRDLQETMDVNAMVYRTEATLKQAEVDIATLKERYARAGVMDKGRRYNTDLLEAVELGFLLDLAQVLVIGARARNESRGGHFREDYPNRDDVNFLRHTMAYRMGGTEPASPTTEVRLDYKPVTMTRYEPTERKY